ncbi:MAG: MFS transporter [Clostridia bacterium]|nr:MFS transporter [Clostridia bacterium]
MQNKQQAMGKRFWLALVIFSLTGQIAWVVENMYFNVFIYQMFRADAQDISLMVAASAVSATLTTIFIGALSDRVGKRKLFIVGGYILWGISILSFALIRLDIIEAVFGQTVSAAGIGVTLVILMDCVMTFFGSSANDAAFNAWLTETAEGEGRGAAEGVNAMMPLVAILAVFGGFMAFDLTVPESWTYIFLIIGSAVTLIGILGIFLIRDSAVVQEDNRQYFKNIFYGFRPSVIKQNPLLYLCLAAFSVFGISIQIFMPYLILYYTEGLKMQNYVVIMAPAIVLASVATALYGRLYDKWKFERSVFPALISLAVGYLVLYLCRSTVPVFIGSLLMMCGYLCGMAVFGAVIRDLTPKHKAGMFQGLRIVAQVLIPGIIGPVIGAAVLSDADTVTNQDGTVSFIPNERIFLAALIVLLVLLAALATLLYIKKRTKRSREGASQNVHTLYTPWAEQADGAWDVYPRPQLRRHSFLSLNGQWQFEAVASDTPPAAYGRTIRVPFSPESPLSGIGERCAEDTTLFYSTTFRLPGGFVRDRVLLHFGAVDQYASVALNGTPLGEHAGGYEPFTFDVTEHVHTEGDNVLTVRVRDELSRHVLPYGKQRQDRGGMWYTPTSGIWQTVWIESVPDRYLRSMRIDADDRRVTVAFDGITEGDMCIQTPEGDVHVPIRDGCAAADIPHARLWSPEDPYLYRFTVQATGGDVVESYFAMRTLSVREVDGYPRLCLNGEPYIFHGLLDQGYYSDGHLTPASPEAYTYDIQTVKALGFNVLRKHIKIEPDIFYYECDRLGMIVFQDMVNNGRYAFLRDTALPTVGYKRRDDRRLHRDEAAREAFIAHMEATVKRLYNHPCICYWTIFNEGWGQFDSGRMYDRLRALDGTRFIDSASGWFKGGTSDVESEHIYFRRVKLRPSDKPIVLSEFGGYTYQVDGHVYNTEKTYGYGSCADRASFVRALRALYEEQVIPAVSQGLCGAIYTQLSDVEDETNGLLTYDRRVAKVLPEELGDLSHRLRAALNENK